MINLKTINRDMENGKIPLVVKGRKLVIDTGVSIIRASVFAVIALCVFGGFLKMMDMMNKGMMDFLPWIAGIIFVLWFLIISYRYKSTFDTGQKLLIMETSYLFIPFSKKYHFKDIKMLGVHCFIQTDEHGGKYENYRLVAAFASNPKKQVSILEGHGFSFDLGLNQLNQICTHLGEITECPCCIVGEPWKEIVYDGKNSYQLKNIVNY